MHAFAEAGKSPRVILFNFLGFPRGVVNMIIGTGLEAGTNSFFYITYRGASRRPPKRAHHQLYGKYVGWKEDRYSSRPIQ